MFIAEIIAESPSQIEFERVNTLFVAPLELIDGTSISAGDLACRAFLSPYGQYMNGQPLRFSKNYGYAPASMVEDLGTDVLPLEHQMGTGEFAAYLIYRESTGQQRFTEEETALILFASLIHDMGETMHPDIRDEVGRVVGDIPYGRKTDDDRQAESAVRYALYRRLYPDVPPATIVVVEGIIMHEPSRLHDVFEAAHCLQALDTGIRAREKMLESEPALSATAGTDETEERRYRTLAVLADDVLTSMISHCEHWAEKFVFAADFMNRYAGIIQAHKAGVSSFSGVVTR